MEHDTHDLRHLHASADEAAKDAASASQRVDDVQIIICFALRHLHGAMSAAEQIDALGSGGSELTESLRSIRRELTSCLDDYVEDLEREIAGMRGYVERQQRSVDSE